MCGFIHKKEMNSVYNLIDIDKVLLKLKT